MRPRIHHRLFVGFLGVVGLLVVLILVLVGSGLRGDLTATFEDELERELDLGAWIVASNPGASADSLARAITERVGYRVTFITLSGVVSGDSYVAPAALASVENHLGRPEVQGAIAGGVAFSQRTSATVGDPLLYAARVVDHDGEALVLRIAAPLTVVQETVDRVQGTVAITGLLAMLLALVVAYFLSRAFGRPLVVLADQATLMAKGELDRRASRNMQVAELDDLALAFNRLADELQARLSELGRERDEMGALIDCMEEGVVALTDDARLLRTNRAAVALLDMPPSPPFAPIGTVVRHSELRSLLEASVVNPVVSREVQIGDRHLLVSSRPLDLGGAVTTLLDITEIRRLEQVRRDFVANASHELKTPLTSIHGYAEALLDSEPPPEMRQTFLEAIHKNSDRLQRLVDDLLDLSRIESGGWIADAEAIDVARVVAEAWEPYAVRASEQDVEFSVDVDRSVRGDRAALVQIFRNLLENALRHSDSGGHVHVGSKDLETGWIQVSVSDDGEGIPSRSLPRIFERFFRADSSRARDFGGTGLGLSIVRHLVGAMGGSVSAESEVGRGTTIRLRLPAA